MRILLLGKNGQVGWELQHSLAPLGEVLTFGSQECNLTDANQIRETVREASSQLIVNAAAYNAVDQAESQNDIAIAVNAIAPGILAEEAIKMGAGLIHYSTDYVFDGEKGEPYTEQDLPNPINAYGESKLAGEQAIRQIGGSYLILRTSWVYSLRRDSFVTKVLQWARKHPVLRIVTDQVSSPTWARMLAKITAQVAAMSQGNIAAWLYERRGVFHLGGSGCVSRFELAKAILAHDPDNENHATQEVLPALSDDFPTPARRPSYSALNCDSFADTFGLRLPDWEIALSMALEN